MNTNKAAFVTQSGNDVEGCRSQKVLFQANMRVFLQYSAKKRKKLLPQLCLSLPNNVESDEYLSSHNPKKIGRKEKLWYVKKIRSLHGKVLFEVLPLMLCNS